jgi:hypothetical protein
LLKGLAGGRFVQPSNATIAKPCAGRVRDDQEIPTVVQHFPNVTLKMTITVALRGKQIARPRIVPLFKESISDHARIFAGNEDAKDAGRRIGFLGKRLHGTLLSKLFTLARKQVGTRPQLHFSGATFAAKREWGGMWIAVYAARTC